MLKDNANMLLKLEHRIFPGPEDRKEREKWYKNHTDHITYFYEAYSFNLEDTLRVCNKKGYRALFMPELVDLRIRLPKEHDVWNHWFSTRSLVATGKSKKGKKVVLYAHIPHPLSEPDDIGKAIKQETPGGVGIISKKEFQKLLGKEDGKKVFVVDYSTLLRKTSGLFSLEKALIHPQTIPFLGGEERAEMYFEKLRNFGEANVHVLYPHKDPFNKPVGRLLYLGGNHGTIHNNPKIDSFSIASNISIDSQARFYGVKDTKVSKQKEP